MHKCEQEQILKDIKDQLSSVEAKLDNFLERIVVTETKMGFITTGLAVVIAPLLVGIAVYFLTGG